MQHKPITGRHVVGGVLEDRWQLSGCIGEHRNETLFFGTDLVEGGNVFVRCASPDWRGTRAVDLAACRILRSLPHPNLEMPLAWREATGPDYVVFPWLQGETLADALGTEWALSSHRVARVLVDAARGLSALHRLHLSHRHISPERLWFTGANRSVLRVAGYVRFSVGAEAQHAMFQAPEQVLDDPAGAAADVYALGVVAYRAISGTHFAIEAGMEPALAHLTATPPSLEGRADPSIARLVAWMLRKNPAERPSMAQVAAIAMAVANDVPVDLPKQSFDAPYAPRSSESTTRLRALIGGAITAPGLRVAG